MMTSTKATSNINMEKYRLRRFVERLVDMDEVEIHDEPVPLTGLGTIIEKTEKAVLFKSVGPEKAEMVAKTAASRKRLIAAFETKKKSTTSISIAWPIRSRWWKSLLATLPFTAFRSRARRSILPSCHSTRTTPTTAVAILARPPTTRSIRQPDEGMSAAAG
jgi:3-polyprenyl-4-hydroxybenzoate decarboxylase